MQGADSYVREEFLCFWFPYASFMVADMNGPAQRNKEYDSDSSAATFFIRYVYMQNVKLSTYTVVRSVCSCTKCKLINRCTSGTIVFQSCVRSSAVHACYSKVSCHL